MTFRLLRDLGNWKEIQSFEMLRISTEQEILEVTLAVSVKRVTLSYNVLKGETSKCA